MTARVRESNIELLRLLLMFMILVHHGIVFGFGLINLSNGIKPADNLCSISIEGGVNIFCIVAVNVFILITGYFGIKLSLNRVLQLLVPVLIYTLLFTSSVYVYEGNIKSFVSSLFLLSHTRYWFIKYYILLMLLSPVINSYFDTQSYKKSKNTVLITLIIISSYLGFVWGEKTNVDGYTLLQFVMLYIIGRYIYFESINLTKIKSLLLYLFPSIVNFILFVICFLYAKYALAWRLMYYNNILVILSSIGLFMFFRELRFTNKWCNKISKHSLSIYLIHVSLICFPVYIRLVELIHTQVESRFLAILALILLCILILLVCIAIDICLTPVFKFISAKIETLVVKYKPINFTINNRII